MFLFLLLDKRILFFVVKFFVIFIIRFCVLLIFFKWIGFMFCMFFLRILVVCFDMFEKNKLWIVLDEFFSVKFSLFLLMVCRSVWILVGLRVLRFLKINIRVLMCLVEFWFCFFSELINWFFVCWLKLLKILVIILCELCLLVCVRFDMNLFLSVFLIFFKIFFWMGFIVSICEIYLMVKFFGRVLRIFVVCFGWILDRMIVIVWGYLFLR